MRDGSGKWLPSKLDTLLEISSNAVHSIPGGPKRWSLGEGAALSVRLRHRSVYSACISLNSATNLRDLSPSRNPTVAAMSEGWEEVGNSLRLRIEGAGIIDFITAPTLLDDPTSPLEFQNGTIPVDRPAEVAAKLIAFHGSKLTPQDVFDLAAVAAYAPGAVEDIAGTSSVTDRRVKAAAHRIKLAGRFFRKRMRDFVNPTGCGEEIMETADEAAQHFLSEILRRRNVALP